MSEEFSVNGSFRNGATVYGKEFLALAWRVVMDDARNDFLTGSTLTDDKHGKVGRCHLERNVYGTIQPIAVAHDAVLLFYRYEFLYIHLGAKLRLSERITK